MALIISNKEQIQEYYDSERINQSKLKDLLKGYHYVVNKKEEQEPSRAMIIGSAVDCLLLGEEGDFEDLYYISTISILPSEKEIKIADMLFDLIKHKTVTLISTFELSPVFHKDEILNTINHFEWQTRWKEETRLNKIVNSIEEYFYEKVRSIGKTIISSKESELINKIVNSLKTNSRTKRYFDRDFINEDKSIEIYYQLPIYFEYKDLKCKSLLDIVIVEKKDEEIHVIPVDLKTMGDYTINFIRSLKQFRYDIQGAFYQKALLKYFTEDNKLIVINAPLFIVESTLQQGLPLIYSMCPTLINIGKNGRKAIYSEDGYLLRSEIKGFEQLIDDYKFYVDTDWAMPREIAGNSSRVLKLDWNGIKID